MTVLTVPPNKPDGEIGTPSNKALSLFGIPKRLSHRCLSIATKPAIEQSIARAICLVAERQICGLVELFNHFGAKVLASVKFSEQVSLVGL